MKFFIQKLYFSSVLFPCICECVTGSSHLSVLCVRMMSHFLFAFEDWGEVVFGGSLQCNAQLQNMGFCLQKYGEGGWRQNHMQYMSTGRAQIRLICLTD